MGTSGPGPLDNDAAADFLGELHRTPSRRVAKALHDISKVPAGKYLQVDLCAAGWAACELVALSFGYGDQAALEDNALEIVAKLKPAEDLRLLALQALNRIGDHSNSELASLWHEGSDGPAFDGAIAHLRTRLEAASHGARDVARPKAGDLICVPIVSPSAGLVVVQVVGPREVAVFDGLHSDRVAALEAVKVRSARRIPTSVNKLLRRGQVIGLLPVRKDLKGRKFYAGEVGSIDDYVLSTASAGGTRIVKYNEARDYDLLRPYSEADIQAVALGKQPAARVRSPEEREAALRARKGAEWAGRREATTPGPFGDVVNLQELVTWIWDYGIEHAVHVFHAEAAGLHGYGRPNEYPERRSYAFAALVALWRGTLSRDLWLATLAARFPPAPSKALMGDALVAARVLSGRVLTVDSELRMIWEGADDRGAQLRACVSSLQDSLA